MTADPVVISGLPAGIEKSQYSMFVHGGQLYFELPVAQPVSIRIYDIAGRTVASLAQQLNMMEGMNSMTLPVMNAGIYIVELRTATGAQSLKLIR